MRRTPLLVHSPELSEALLEAAPDAIVVVDGDARIVLVNKQAEHMFGYSRDELLGEPVEMLLPERFRHRHVEERERYATRPRSRRMGTGLELLARRRDGTEFPVEIALSPITSAQGALTISTIRDASERKRVESSLRHLSTHDPLTGLYNRGFFENELERLERGRQFPLGIVVVDVDGLKSINDALGHAAGDDLLKRTAAVLTRIFRAEDIVARIGGDEFAVLLPGADALIVAQVLSRVLDELDKQNASHPFPLRLSMGSAMAKKGDPLAEVLRQADRQMYREKLSRLDRPLEEHGE